MAEKKKRPETWQRLDRYADWADGWAAKLTSASSTGDIEQVVEAHHCLPERNPRYAYV